MEISVDKDILKNYKFRGRISAAYLAWDRRQMDITIQKGIYKSFPYIEILKDLIKANEML
ncbi:uncharacterized protein N7483_007453 [Penicillium malachiteum]|uniref:uncharacterized protein n=1 Tax=Penicillium malachiteum TaxID=1324776 RepID=UPI0025497870|nr:uncharacterized protein N7483_007453 [Penicillium malachiteum]KAJ5726096.1 hypothetical protein N7483_007453 [Penicillium malachiteum]